MRKIGTQLTSGFYSYQIDMLLNANDCGSSFLQWWAYLENYLEMYCIEKW